MLPRPRVVGLLYVAACLLLLYAIDLHALVAIDLHVLDERIGEQDLTAARFILKGTTKNETPIHLLSAGKADPRDFSLY